MTNMKSRFDPKYAKMLRAIVTERTRSGITQSAAAIAVGVSQSTWSKIEVGERRIDVVELERFCLATGLRLSEFISMIEKDWYGE